MALIQLRRFARPTTIGRLLAVTDKLFASWNAAAKMARVKSFSQGSILSFARGRCHRGKPRSRRWLLRDSLPLGNPNPSKQKASPVPTTSPSRRFVSGVFAELEKGRLPGPQQQ
ncbi:hypothetical protein VTH06DRAFT_385 [Thermothelomyces fergusii]